MEYVSDQGVNVEFYRDSVPSAYQSEAAGHPVFVEKDFVRIMIPGSQNTIIESPVEDYHKRRFPIQWAKFQSVGGGGEMSGWKLESWPAINTAQVKTLKYMGIHTVEQLAEISDTAAQQVGHGTMELRTRAKAAVAAAQGNAVLEAQAMENKRLNDELENLKAVVAQFAAPEEARRKPGRPAKVEEVA